MVLLLRNILISSFAVGALAQAPIVQSEALQNEITSASLLQHAQALEDIAYATPRRNRVMASPGHVNTVNYLLDQLEPLSDYYDISTQDFDVLVAAGTASFRINGEDQEAEIAGFSPSGEVNAKLVLVSGAGCDESDYVDVNGNIALISRGSKIGAECTLGSRSSLAAAAGAVGAIIYNDVEGSAAPSLGEPASRQKPYVPTAAVRLEFAETILDQINAGQKVTGALVVDSEVRRAVTTNVFAQSKGGDQNNVLQIGAHSDSVSAGPGINDNGSGSAALLSIAQRLASWSVNNSVRFSWWGGEESGLLGSRYYVRSLPAAELAKIRAYINADMIASPNYIYAIYDGDGSGFGIEGPPGSAQIEKFFEDHFTSKQLNFVPTAFDGRSDYGPFLSVDIPCGGLFTGAEGRKTQRQAQLFGGRAGVAYDVNYHRRGDNMTNLNEEAFLVNARALAAIVAEYGISLEAIPERSFEAVERIADIRPELELPMAPKAHGSCGSDW